MILPGHNSSNSLLGFDVHAGRWELTFLVRKWIANAVNVGSYS